MKSMKTNNIWAEGAFVQKVSQKELEKKGRTISMGHNEEMNYNCRTCNAKISAHNNDWHDEMCDACFNKAHF